MILRFTNHRISRSASALAYSLLFAFFPLLLTVNGLLGRYGDTLRGVLAAAAFIPDDVRSIALEVLSFAEPDGCIGRMLWGILLALYFMTLALGRLLDALDEASGRQKPRRFFPRLLLSVIFAGAVLAETLLMLILPGLGGVLWDQALPYYPQLSSYKVLWTLLRFGLSSAPAVLLFTLLYWAVSDRRFSFLSQLPGALLAVFSWISVSLGFSLYLSVYSRYTTLYGAVGGVLVLMLWLYLTASIFILGGEANAQLREGSRDR